MFVPKGVRLSEFGNNRLGKNLDKKNENQSGQIVRWMLGREGVDSSD